MHAARQGSTPEHASKQGVADQSILKVQNPKHGDREEPVVVQSAENVQFFIHFGADHAAVEHVENVHQNEGMEEQSVVLLAGCSDTVHGDHFLVSDQVVPDIEHGRPSVEEDAEGDELVDNLGVDLAPHGGKDLTRLVFRVDRLS